MITANINFLNPVGDGISGKIYEQKDGIRPNEYVFKEISIQNFKSLQKVIQEIVLGFSCDHPFILPIKGFDFKEGSNANQSTAYLKLLKMNGNLNYEISELFNLGSFFPETYLIDSFYSLACALEYLHVKGIAHRDIKPANILLDQQKRTILADLGSATFICEDSESEPADRAGTTEYMAPEVLDNMNTIQKKELYKSDMWSLGAVLLKMCLLKKFNLIDLLKEGKGDIIWNQLATCKGGYSGHLVDLIRNLLNVDPTQRKTAKEVRESLENMFPDRTVIMLFLFDTEVRKKSNKSS